MAKSDLGYVRMFSIIGKRGRFPNLPKQVALLK